VYLLFRGEVRLQESMKDSLIKAEFMVLLAWFINAINNILSVFLNFLTKVSSIYRVQAGEE